MRPCGATGRVAQCPLPIAAFRAQGRLGQLSANNGCHVYRSIFFDSPTRACAVDSAAVAACDDALRRCRLAERLDGPIAAT